MFGRKKLREAEAVIELMTMACNVASDAIEERDNEIEELKRENRRLALQYNGIKAKYKMLYTSLYGKVTPIKRLVTTPSPTGRPDAFTKPIVAVGVQFDHDGCTLTVMRKEKDVWITDCQDHGESRWSQSVIEATIAESRN